jgi:hypothetical protein
VTVLLSLVAGFPAGTNFTLYFISTKKQSQQKTKPAVPPAYTYIYRYVLCGCMAAAAWSMRFHRYARD